MIDDRKYLGTTVKYPLVVENGKVSLATGDEAVKQSVLDIIQTSVGEIFFNNEYGSEIEKALFEPNDNISNSLAEIYIIQALKKWEKRVNFVESSITREDGKVTIEVTYRLLNINELTTVSYTLGINT